MAQKARFFGKKAVTWQSLRPGIWVLKLWSGDQDPQVAVLQFTAEAYNKIREDISGFLNETKIFGKTTKVQNHSGPGVILSNLQQQHSRVYLIVQHGKPSRSPWVLLPGDPAPEDPQWIIHPRGPSLPIL
ncbi:MAG TPA: hypothetical protein VGD60_11720 [Candidatus Acidoferrales bacterium]